MNQAGVKNCLGLVALFLLIGTPLAEAWRGLTVAPEQRCSPYDKQRDYPYSQAVERHDIVRRLGAVHDPCTDTCFDSANDADIEHVVALRVVSIGIARQIAKLAGWTERG